MVAESPITEFYSDWYLHNLSVVIVDVIRGKSQIWLESSTAKFDRESPKC